MIKKTLSILVILILITFSVLAYSPFCAGYTEGYKAGYCYGKTYCISPITPLCPIPHIGENSYMDGYNRGFLEGLNQQ